MWTDVWYFLQAAKKLSDQWNLTRIGEDPAIDWMADVSHYIFKIFSEGKGYEQCKFSRERFIILYLHKFGCLLGVDHTHTNPSLYKKILERISLISHGTSEVFYSDKCSSCYKITHRKTTKWVQLWEFFFLILNLKVFKLRKFQSPIEIEDSKAWMDLLDKHCHQGSSFCVKYIYC